MTQLMPVASWLAVLLVSARAYAQSSIDGGRSDLPGTKQDIFDTTLKNSNKAPPGCPRSDGMSPFYSLAFFKGDVFVRWNSSDGPCVKLLTVGGASYSVLIDASKTCGPAELWKTRIAENLSSVLIQSGLDWVKNENDTIKIETEDGTYDAIVSEDKYAAMMECWKRRCGCEQAAEPAGWGVLPTLVALAAGGFFISTGSLVWKKTKSEKLEAENARKKAEEEAARKKAEEEDARKKAEAEGEEEVEEGDMADPFEMMGGMGEEEVYKVTMMKDGGEEEGASEDEEADRTEAVDWDPNEGIDSKATNGKVPKDSEDAGKDDEERLNRKLLHQPTCKPNRSYSPEEFDMLYRLFASCDTSDVDKISQAALLSGLGKQRDLARDLGFPDGVSAEFCGDLFKDASSAADPVLGFWPFEDWYEQMIKGKKAMPKGWGEAGEVLRAFFQKCDVDDSGTVNKDEFLAGLQGSDDAKKLLHLPDSISRADLDALWKTIDSDGSGELSYDELFAYYAGYWRHHALIAGDKGTAELGEVLTGMREAEGNGQADEAEPDPTELMIKQWSVKSRQVYDDNLQRYDENLLKAEKALALLKKQNLSSIKGRANLATIFEALPKLVEAIDTLNKGVGGSHDFLHAAFDRSDRIRRLKAIICAGQDFDEEPVDWSVKFLMQQYPDTAGEKAHVRIVDKLIKSFQSVSTIIYDYHGKRKTTFEIRSVEESGVNVQENKAMVAMRSRAPSSGGQQKAIFDASIKILDEKLPRAQELTRQLLSQSASAKRGAKGRKQSLELFEHLGSIRDAMESLAHGELELRVSAFGGTSKRTEKLKELLSGGSPIDSENPSGGVLRLMRDDPQNAGQASQEKTIGSLKKSYLAAAGVASDSPH